jgi:hypothetical protein
MNESLLDRNPCRHDDAEVARLLGPARLAYFTPVREYPPLSDWKSVMILSLCGLMVTVTCLFLNDIESMLASGRGARTVLLLVGVSWLASILLGAGYGFRALVQPFPPMGACTAFYKTIAARSLEEYCAILHTLSHDAAMRDILNYNYSIAVLSTEKFRLIRKSVVCLCMALALWMLLMILIASRMAPFWRAGA